MQGEEPATCLVNTLVDKVGGIELRRDSISLISAVNQRLTVGLSTTSHLTLKRIVQLRIRHRTRVEPYVDKIALTVHRFALIVHQHDIIDIGAVQVNLIIVFLRVVAWHKTFIFQRVALHYASSH